jgi:outer membrane protein OmpA-like peptidoglycan-associated protein
MRNILAAALAASLGLSAGGALADASRLQIIIGGEAYDGPPRFEVSFDGKVLGERAVDLAIDTGTAGRFEAASDRNAHVQAFDFDIPEAVFNPEGEVRVRLVNEAFGGEGSDRDRNLYLAAVAVNGRAVTISGLGTATEAGMRDNQTLGEFLVLLDGTVSGVGMPPAGGWPEPGEAVVPAATPQAAAPAVQPVPEPAEARPAPPAGPTVRRIPVTAAAPAQPAEPVAEAPSAELVTASVGSEPAGQGEGCMAETRYNVLGFNQNSNDVTPRIIERLEQVLADIGTRRCNVQVVGYSDNDGLHATNALFSLERAQNVLVYLRQKGLPAVSATATGAGGTNAFGDRPSDNRRVVITVKP